MSAERSTPPFTISADSAFTEEGVWIIDVQLRVATTSEPISVVLDKARPVLTDTILKEALRGHSFGATQVQVHLDTGRRVTNFILPVAALRTRSL